MRQTLEKVSKVLRDNEGSCFYRWIGVADQRHPLIRLDRVYLNILFIDDDKGNCRYRRILGYRKGAGSDDETVVFSPKLLRVQDGPRRGQLVIPKCLWDNERWKPAGVSKVLTIGKYPWSFSEQRVGDRQIIDMFEELLTADPPKLSRISYPVFYLVTSARNREVRLSSDPGALRYLQGISGYDDMLAPSENMVALASKAAKALPDNKLAWPYRFFCRAGVVAADPTTMHGWSMVPKTAIQRDIGIEELGAYAG